MLTISRWLASGCAIACLFVASHAAFAADAPSKTPKYDIHKPLGDGYVANQPVADEQNRLVVFRASTAASAATAGVVSVYLGDKYHVSLQPNAYAVVCLETDKIDIRTRLILPDADPIAANDSRQDVELKKGITQFVRIGQLNDGRTQLQEVPTRIAQAELQDARQQMHTRSRVTQARPCKEAKTAATEPNVITFGADATFHPKKTDFKGLTPAGKDALLQVVDKINKKYASATQVSVRVVGYADDAADEPTNQRLSMARAQAIRHFFLQNGFKTAELTEEARGSKNDEKSVALNTPKRRVDIEVSVTTP